MYKSAYCSTTLIILFSLTFVLFSFTNAFCASANQKYDSEIEALSLFYSDDDVIYSVSKREENIMESPSAVYTVSAEDIKYSGAKKLTDIFRMVPGVDVVDINSYYTGVQSRGYSFFPKYARHMLVLIDGRTVYSPQINTTFWDQIPVFVENIERVEVIKGPNAALYGANAFNGVINIITKDLDETKGGLVSTTVGNRETSWSTVRLGGSNGKLSYQATAGYHETEGFSGSRNRFRKPQATFRADYKIDKTSMLSLHSGYAGGDREIGLTDDPEVTSYYLMTKYEKELSEKNKLSVQYYHDYRNSAMSFGHDDKLRSNDVEVQFNRNSKKYNLVFGSGYRIDMVRHGFLSGEDFNAYTTKGSHSLNLETDYNHIFKTFINFTYHINKKLHLTGAMMLEDNGFVKELMLSPKGSIVYLPEENQSFRFSVSRAYRTPSFIEEAADFSVPFREDPGYIGQRGDSGLSPERIVAFELGYRGIFLDSRLTANVELFYHDINDLITYDDHGTNIFQYMNGKNNTVKGLETSFSWQVYDWWKLKLNYTYQEGSDDDFDGYIIEQKAGLLNRFLLPKGFVANVQTYYVDQLHFVTEPFTPESTVNDYIRLDIRFSKTFLNDKIELAVIGQNLLDTRHEEYPEALGAAEANRMYFFELSYRFGL